MSTANAIEAFQLAVAEATLCWTPSAEELLACAADRLLCEGVYADILVRLAERIWTYNISDLQMALVALGIPPPTEEQLSQVLVWGWIKSYVEDGVSCYGTVIAQLHSYSGFGWADSHPLIWDLEVNRLRRMECWEDVDEEGWPDARLAEALLDREGDQLIRDWWRDNSRRPSWLVPVAQ